MVGHAGSRTVAGTSVDGLVVLVLHLVLGVVLACVGLGAGRRSAA